MSVDKFVLEDWNFHEVDLYDLYEHYTFQYKVRKYHSAQVCRYIKEINIDQLREAPAFIMNVLF